MKSRLLTATVTQPAAGADFKFIPAGMEEVRLLSLSAILTTSAVVGARQPSLRFQTREPVTYWAADTIFPQAASLAVRYSWAIGTGLGVANPVVASGKAAAPLPHLWLDEDDTVASTTLLLDVGDQWSSIAYRCLVGSHYRAVEELAELSQAFTAFRG